MTIALPVAAVAVQTAECHPGFRIDARLFASPTSRSSFPCRGSTAALGWGRLLGDRRRPSHHLEISFGTASAFAAAVNVVFGTLVACTTAFPVRRIVDAMVDLCAGTRRKAAALVASGSTAKSAASVLARRKGAFIRIS